MKCVIGLGNIGNEYNKTRHNVGFESLDYILSKYNLKLDKKKSKCMYTDTVINNEKVVFVKPTTYMNLSGEAVVQIIKWYKIPIENICIIYDDIDLVLGDVRFRENGSSGTHNGMKNIIDNIKSEKISRIRVGIENRNKDFQIELADYVLSKFSKEELNYLEEEKVFDKVFENVDNFLTKT